MSSRGRALLLTAAALLAVATAQAEQPALPPADEPCAGCHAEAIGAATYATSVHGANGCVSCHADVDLSAHPGNVGALKRSARPSTTASQACAGCHADARAKHDPWLPNAATHLAVIECAACHAPNAGRRVELRLQDHSRQELAVTPEDQPAAKKLDAAALRRLIERRSASGGAVMVVGRIDVADPRDAHRLAPKASAVRECRTCHSKGSEPFSRVALSLTGSDGSRNVYEVEPSVLNDPASIDALRGFYALGGTRIAALDILLGLAVMGGIGAPLGHAIVRRLMRRNGTEP